MRKTNKQELEQELEKVSKKLKDEKDNNAFLLTQQNKFREMAERAGSEAAAYRAMVERLQEELERLESTLKGFEQVKK